MLFRLFDRHPQYIDTVETLAKELGNSFIILCGSAISGVNTPHVPMVTEIESEILKSVADQLSRGSKSQKLVAEYALALANGRYQSILRRTKFEMFLWRLQRAAGKTKVDDLLYRIYVCDIDEYGLNHSAISFLLEKRLCQLCLTTNFDNAIELSYLSQYGYDLSVQHQTYTLIQQLEKLNSPLLLKLHGDAREKTCKATSPDLSGAKLKDSYSFLQNLLHGQKILVVGYSGTGDVDIAPHLSRINAELFWCNHRKPFPRIHPEQRNVLCNLRVRTTSSNENLLLELAKLHGWQDSWNGRKHEWISEIDTWIKGISNNELRNFIVSMLSWDTSWPHVHMAYYWRKEENTEESALDVAEAFTQIAAYTSAKQQLNLLLKQPNLKSDIELEARTLLGFAYWREGHFKTALETFKEILSKYLAANTTIQNPIQFAGIARVYLETIGEMLSYETNYDKRRQIYLTTEAEKIALLLSSWIEPNYTNYYLAQIAILNIDHAIGKGVKSNTVRDIFDECYHMEEWASASLAAQLLLNVAYKDGVRAIFKVTPKLWERRNLKLIFKNFAMFFHCTLKEKFPFMLKLLNGRLLRRFTKGFLELKCRQKRRKWEQDWQASKFKAE